jgi:hypothetical protein
MSIILRVDGLLGKIAGTVYGEQVMQYCRQIGRARMSSVDGEINRRRKLLYPTSPEELRHSAQRWGLALSGGGIRSATFCLGFLQSLAKARLPENNDLDPNDLNKTPLIARFDLLSTVSGGGYVGSFISGLFRRAESPVTEAKDNARKTFEILKCDPPGRMGQSNALSDRPLRWLRDNGRYLAPNNSGDLLLDIAIALRNLCAVHYVIGVSLITLFFWMYLLRLGSIKCPWWSSHAIKLEETMQPACLTYYFGCTAENLTLWWSPWFVVAGFFVLVGMIPLGVAYWLNQDKASILSGSAAFWVSGVAALGLALLAYCLFCGSPLGVSSSFTLVTKCTIASLALILVIAFFWALCLQGDNIAVFRAKLTRYLRNALLLTLVIVAFATIETLGQSLYLWLHLSEWNPLSLGGIGAAIVAVATAIRQLPKAVDSGSSSFVKKLPINVVIGGIGILLFTVLLVAWQVISTGLFFQWTDPTANSSASLAMIMKVGVWDWYPLTAGLLLLALTIASGLFLGFVNLSTLQPLYGARLLRAYLGASNTKRFDSEKGQSKVTDAHKDDDFTFTNYFNENHAGPAHIINVTVNATAGSGDALTQRDRQGIPMTISADGFSYGESGELEVGGENLSISRWIGISGAAVSTGLGRHTKLGTSIALMFVNARLGWWWFSGRNGEGWTITRLFEAMFRSQSYLLRETYAKFNGTDGTHWYLSDGGHFENTGVYELLRRRVPVIVCCDCGADPDYKFGDLANLMRLARIDLRAEFVSLAGDDRRLKSIFGNNVSKFVAKDIAELRATQVVDPKDKIPQSRAKFALAYRIEYKNAAGQLLPEESSVVLIVKPAVLSDSPHDLMEYKSVHPNFPQESTGDQFFDDAQWESYRRLGVQLGDKIFS